MPEHRRQHGDGGLHVGADVAGVDRDVVGLGRREAGLVGAVDEQAPDLLERDAADELLDVDPAVAEGGAFLVRLGDLGVEGDDPLEPVVRPRSCRRMVQTVAPRVASGRLGSAP